MDTNLIIAQILKTNENTQEMEAQLQSRVTLVIEMNRVITEINEILIYRTVILKRLKRFRQHKTVIINFNLDVTQWQMMLN